MKKNSENRRVKRYLLRRGSRKDEVTEYVDNLGFIYEYEWVAKMSSFYNIVSGCLTNGFPIVVGWLWYNAWAFYPFFFVNKILHCEDPITTLNHERIHVRQQRDIHLVISIPLLVLSGFSEWFGWFNVIYLLCIIPFVPTLIYGIEMLRVWRVLGKGVTFQEIRKNTCFEREAVMRSPNEHYLLTRKFMAVLAYTGWKHFQHF